MHITEPGGQRYTLTARQGWVVYPLKVIPLGPTGDVDYHPVTLVRSGSVRIDHVRSACGTGGVR